MRERGRESVSVNPRLMFLVVVVAEERFGFKKCFGPWGDGLKYFYFFFSEERIKIIVELVSKKKKNC